MEGDDRWRLKDWEVRKGGLCRREGEEEGREGSMTAKAAATLKELFKRAWNPLGVDTTRSEQLLSLRESRDPWRRRHTQRLTHGDSHTDTADVTVVRWTAPV